jgi:hypothetical protein
MKRTAIAAALALVAANPAQAADGRLSARITAGTLGIGPEIGYRLTDKVGVRGNATFLSFSHNFSSDDIDYDGKPHLRSGGVMIDLFPFGGGFFVSGGARINGNDGRARATPTSNVRVGANTFTPAQIGTLSGDAETKNFAPSLTLGYSGTMRSGFVAGVEAGALFQGKVRVRNFRSSSNLIPAANLEQERIEVQDDVDDYKVYPVLQLTLGYRF